MIQKENSRKRTEEVEEVLSFSVYKLNWLVCDF